MNFRSVDQSCLPWLGDVDCNNIGIQKVEHSEKHGRGHWIYYLCHCFVCESPV